MSTQSDKEYAKFVTDYSKTLVYQVLDLIDNQAYDHGPKVIEDVSIYFISCFIASVLYRTLSRDTKHLKTDKEKQQYIIDKYADIKVRIQEAVSTAFQGAMRTHANNEVEYYCQIKLVPPVANKKLC